MRGGRGVALALRGEIRASPDARWIRFTAAQTIEATGGDDAFVDIEIADDGRPLSCRADRPRVIGKRGTWKAACSPTYVKR